MLFNAAVGEKGRTLTIDRPRKAKSRWDHGRGQTALVTRWLAFQEDGRCAVLLRVADREVSLDRHKLRGVVFGPRVERGAAIRDGTSDEMNRKREREIGRASLSSGARGSCNPQSCLSALPSLLRHPPPSLSPSPPSSVLPLASVFPVTNVSSFVIRFP